MADATGASLLPPAINLPSPHQPHAFAEAKACGKIYSRAGLSIDFGVRPTVRSRACRNAFLPTALQQRLRERRVGRTPKSMDSPALE